MKVLEEVRRRVYAVAARRDAAVEDLALLVRKQKQNSARKEILAEALSVAEAAAHLGRRQVKDTIEKLVTSALRSVFDTEELSFRVEFITRRNQVEADFFLDSASRGQSMDAIMDEYGGGYVDVIAFSLRVALLELLHIPGPVVIDESFKMVSRDGGFAARAGRFLRQLSEDLGRQIILVTHNEEIAAAAHKRLRVVKQGTVSKVVEE